MKTINPPGTVNGDISVPNRIGDKYSRIPVATAEAKHFTTAFASKNQPGLLNHSRYRKPTFVDRSNSNANKDITDDDKAS